MQAIKEEEGKGKEIPTPVEGHQKPKAGKAKAKSSMRHEFDPKFGVRLRLQTDERRANHTHHMIPTPHHRPVS